MDADDDMLFGAVEVATTSQGNQTIATLETPHIDESTIDNGFHTNSAQPDLPVTFPPAESVDDARHHALACIEQIFESMIDVVTSGNGHLTIKLKSRASNTSTTTTRTRAVRYPGKTAREAWRCTVLIRMLEVIHEALTKDVVITKREIYYRDPALFHNQTVVDRLIDDMAFTIGVPRASLNVSAAAKGLTVGAFAINSSDGSQTQNFLTQEGLLIPKLNDGDTISMPAVRWILVVEKEAVFRALITSSFWGLHRHQGIVLTGKGYPDLHTRTLLHTLSTPSPRNAHATASVHALVDLDPDGLAILATYKHGSRALAHEAITTRVPGLHWLGVRSQDALNAMVAGKEDSSGGEALLLRLTRRDRAMAARMLQRTECAEEETWRRELQIMLMLNIKAEIEALEEGWRGGLAAWLGMKLSGAWVERESG